MPPSFRVVTTPPFERDARKLSRRNPAMVDLIERLVATLKEDPANSSRRYDIKKLKDVPSGEGQWRIRAGDYRLRYDIINNDVVLYALSHRREAY